MREQFPRKSPGDDRFASEINRENQVLRTVDSSPAGQHSVGIHSSVFKGTSPPGAWRQFIFEVSSIQIDTGDGDFSGLYLGKIRWYSTADEEWKTDDKEWELDASDVGLRLSVGDRLVVWWDAQRGMFIPADSHRHARPLLDLAGTMSDVVAETDVPSTDIRFELEISDNGSTGWQVVNDRVIVVNGIANEFQEPTVYGHGMYTFRVSGVAYLRVTAQTDIDYVDVDLDSAALRLEVKATEAIQHSLGTIFSASTEVDGWSEEAKVNNPTSTDEVEFGQPLFTVESGGVVKIDCPVDASSSGDPDEFTIAAELVMGFALSQRSSSSISTSSESSISTSSESSISTSSASTTCKTCFDDICAEDITGYNGTNKQALIHGTDGCLGWMDIEPC